MHFFWETIWDMHLMRPPVLPVDYTQQNAESRPHRAGFLRYRVSWSLLCRSFSVLGRRIPVGRSAAGEMGVTVPASTGYAVGRGS